MYNLIIWVYLKVTHLSTTHVDNLKLDKHMTQYTLKKRPIIYKNEITIYQIPFTNDHLPLFNTFIN